MPASSDEYAETGGLKCPVCGSDNIQGDCQADCDGPNATSEADCPDCGATWTDNYHISGYTNLKDKHGEEIE